MKQIRTTIILFWCLTAVMFVACTEQHAVPQQMAADSLIAAAHQERNYDSIVSLADKHEKDGTLSTLKACYWRGYAYSRLRKMRMAEMEWKNALAQSVETDDELDYYAQSANRLVGLLYMKTEYAEAIQMVLPAVKLLKERHYTTNNDYSNLLTFVGSCELRLNQSNNAAQNYAQAWQQYLATTKANHDIDSYTSAIVGMVTIVDAYLQTAHYQETSEWTTRMDSLLQQCRRQPGVRDDYIDKQWARLCLYRASALEGMGEKTKAAKAYRDAQQTRYAKTNDFKIEAAHYLMTAQR